MKILKTVQKIPGGMMVVPLILGALVNTFFGDALKIGGFTTALFKNGASCLIGLFIFCNGAMINVRQARKPLFKGLILTVTKFLLGAVLGWAVNKAFGPIGVIGITPLAIIAAMTNSNGGLYTALAGEYGDSSDVGALAVLAINDGPFLTMVAFGATGLADIPLIDLVACVVPLVIGFILGNLDEDLRHFLGSQMNLLIPFFAFPLGASLNFRTIINAGAPGLILGVVVTIITGFGGYFVSRVYGKKMNPAAAAIGSTAGNAAATPNAIAASDASLAPYAAAATAQVAAAVIVTAVLCPLLTSYLAKRAKGENKETA